MRIFYFVHITGTDTGISGVPRVVRNLARELVRRSEVECVPVCWRADLSAIVHAEQKLLDNLSRHGGPALTASAQAQRPIEPSPGDWLLIAEVPHLQSHFANHPPVHLDEVLGGARRIGLQVAIVLHDILPLIFGIGAKAGQAFVELSPIELQARDEDAERLAFSRYAHAAALVDLVLPVSRTAGQTLREWLIGHGHRLERLPPMAPALLPEEIFGAAREDPLQPARSGERSIEFLAVGFVNAQKNQLAAMAALLRLVERRPELDVRLHLVGLIGADIAAAASLMVKRAQGRIVLHGRLPDGQIRELTRRARATVFVSFAEGFGLPVAESLWRGKPCLCSNRGSIGEIARGGGCLAVDPASIEAISAGFETLAADPERYADLLEEIAARPFKTWRRYAGQIVNAVCAVSSGRAPDLVEEGAGSTDIRDGSAMGEAVPREAVLFLSAADWLVPDAYTAATRARSLFYGGALNYEAERDEGAQEQTLFFGPYVPLAAGAYVFSFDGDIEGELKLAFTARDGAMHLIETTVSDFNQKFAFNVPEPVERFEIVGMRTPQLRRLTLRSAYGELSAIVPQAGALETPAEGAIAPLVVPAAHMRVHDAYASRQGHRLRSGEAIVFDRDRHADVEEATLFFGPYIDLVPGRYSLRLRGKLEGPLKLRLTHDFGSDCLRELVLTSYEAPVVFESDRRVENFEAVGARTQATTSMRLDAIEIAATPDAELRPEPAPAAKPSWRKRLLGRG